MNGLMRSPKTIRTSKASSKNLRARPPTNCGVPVSVMRASSASASLAELKLAAKAPEPMNQRLTKQVISERIMVGNQFWGVLG